MTTRLIKSSENINGLPIGFQEVEYLQSTGTQYIDMGVGVKANTVFKAVFSVASTATGRSYFGARNSSNERFQIVNSIGIGGGYYLVNSVYPIADKKYEIEMRASGEMYLDGVKRDATTGTFSQVSFERNLWLFATNYYDSSVGAGASTFWKAQIFEGDVLVRDFIPALNPAGRPCMYDLVGKKAYYNLGSGEFTYGREIHYVDYLENIIGQATLNYIPTTYTPTTNTNLEAKVRYTGGASGATWAIGAATWWGIHYQGSGPKIGITNSSKDRYQVYTPYTAGNDITLKLDGSNVYADGTLVGSLTKQNASSTLTLFRYSTSANLSWVGRIYYLDIWDNNGYVNKFRPAIDENGVCFMFDKVTHTCYLNAGTGTFNYGKKLYNSKVRLYKDSEANKLPAGFKRVEYLASDGNQYIDTEILGNGEFDVDYMYYQTQDQSNAIFAGTRSSSQHLNFGQRASGSSFSMAYLNEYWAAISSPAINTNVRVQISYKNGSQTGTLNGTAMTSKSLTGTEATNLSIYIFKRHHYGTDNVTGLVGRIYYFKLWNNGNLVRDFIPALDTTNTPCMYDAVTQTAFYNQGTGQFTYGAVIPDKVRLPQSTEIRFPKGYTEVEYLESTGTQYIDIGVKGDLNSKAEIIYKYPSTSSSTGSGRVFGSRTSASSNGFGIGTASGSIIANESVGAYFSNANIGSTTTAKVAINTWCQTILSRDGAYFNGTKEQFINGSVTDFTTPNNLKLFGFDNNGTMGYGLVQISKCEIWENDRLIRYFIPALDPNGKPCMWDVVTKQPFYNAGTGEFTYGRSIQQVEYLESSGTQYINTGYVPTDTTGVEVKHTICADNGTDNILFGCRQNSGNTRFWEDVDWTQSDSIGWGFNEYSNNISGYRCPLTSDMIGQTIISSFNFMNDRACKVDGVSYDPSITTKTLATITKPMYLFGANNQGNFGYANACKVFYMNVSENQKVVMKLVPAIDSNNVGFMFDRVTHTIFDNAGTGSFTYGSPVPNIIRN